MFKLKTTRLKILMFVIAGLIFSITTPKPIDATYSQEILNYNFDNGTEIFYEFVPCGFKDNVNSFFIKDSIGGKENTDNSICIKVNKYAEESTENNYYTSKPFLIKTLPEKLTEDFVAECSIYSSEDKADSYMAMNINGIYTKVFELKSNGYITLGGTEVSKWRKGRWYHFAIEFDYDCLKANFYINGNLVLNKATIRGVNGTIEYATGIKLCCDCETYGKQGFPVKNESAFDNISLYYGNYDGTDSTLNVGKLILKNEYFLINERESVPTFFDKIETNIIKIYTDSSMENETNDVADGSMAVVFSKDKKSIGYFIAADVSLKSVYSFKENNICIPEKTTVGCAKTNISVAQGVIIAFLNEKGRELKQDEFIANGCTLVLQNHSGYIRKYNINTVPQKEPDFSSTVYNVGENVISGIPQGTDSVSLINSLSADNPLIEIRLYQNGRPVINKSVTEEMQIYTLYNGKSKEYSIKIGTSRTFFEDFEKCSGIFLQNDVWKVVDAHSSGAFFEIFHESENNKTLRMNSVNGINSYLRTGLYDFSNGIEIAFDFKIDSAMKTDLRLMMLDSEKNANYISFLNISNTQKSIVVFDEKNSVALDELSEGWHSVRVRIFDDKKVHIFCDNVEVALIDDYSYMQGGKNFNIKNSGVIFKTIGDGMFFIDDIAIFDNVKLENVDDSYDITVYNTELYITDENGNYIPAESLVEGEMLISTGVWNNTCEEETVCIVVAVMEGDAVSDIYMSEEITLMSDERKSVEVMVTVPEIKDNSTIKVYVWKSLENLVPLKKMSKIEKEGISLPTKPALKKIFNEKSKNVHPRILARNADFDKIRNYIQTDENIFEWNSYVISSADRICENITNEAVNLKSPYYIGYTTELNGNNQILEISRRVKNFVIDLAMAYQMTRESKYSDAVWKIMQFTGLQNTQMSEFGFPDWNDTNSPLDTAEMAGGFAIAYDWCYDSFSENQRKYVRDSIYEYAISRFKNKREIYNSNMVYNSCMIMAAMSIADEAEYKETAFDVIFNAIKNIQYSLGSWIFDGAWEEGSMYAVYTSEYLAKLLATLNSSLGTDFGISNIGVEDALDYLLYIDGPTSTNNYNDSSANQHVEDASLLYYSGLFNKPEYMAEIISRRKTYAHCMGALEMLWYKPDNVFGEFDLTGSKYMQGNEVVVLSNGAWEDRNRGWLSFQGGFSENSHGHYDTGSFVYDSDNIRWISDLGQENYSIMHSSGLERSAFYRVRPEGHNTYVINPNANKIGQNVNAYSKIKTLSDISDNPFAILDMTQCYSEDVSSAVRGYKLLEEGKVLIVKDEIDITTPDSVVYWFLHTGYNVVAEKINDTTVLLTKEGMKKILKLYCDTPFQMSVVQALPLTLVDEEFVCEDYPNPENQNKNSNISKIMIKITGGTEILNVTAMIAPFDFAGNVDMSEKINEWKS